MGVILEISSFGPTLHTENAQFDSLDNYAGRILFKLGDRQHEIEMNVVLFLTETAEFLERLSANGRAIWRLEFEPFRFVTCELGQVKFYIDEDCELLEEAMDNRELLDFSDSVSKYAEIFGKYQ